MFDKPKTYAIEYICDNCEEDNTIEIPLGITIEIFLNQKKAKCENCECFLTYKKEA